MAEAGFAEKLKVFISYSRRDSSDFAEELVAGLELAGFAPFLDRHDIAAGEKWENRLGGLIDQADTVVFVISPEAVKSERCAWEVRRTLEKSKRLLPIVFEPVPVADIPEQLGERQFVRFDSGAGFARPLAQLAEALRRDLDWIREHTRLGELAARWQARGRSGSLLLRGEDVAAAQAWAERRKPDAPGLDEATRAFIAASKQAEADHAAKSKLVHRRVRVTEAVAAIFMLALIVAAAAWWKQDWVETHLYVLAHVHTLTVTQENALKPKDSFQECDDCPSMIVVPAGHFMMGSPEGQGEVYEHPQHTVSIAKPFAVSKFEVTFAAWDACLRAGGCNGYRPNDQNWGRGQQPVITVTWDQAKDYVAWLSSITGKTYRLLSEAEYEYAARGGTQTAYPWGDDVTVNGTAMANCYGCGTSWGGKQTAPVGSFAANGFGLNDMVGNVWEWTEDCYHFDYSDDGTPVDGAAWTGSGCFDRVLRGGAWLDEPVTLRSASRTGTSVDTRDSHIGFRVARTLLTP